jgi:hypothetical protein
MPGVLLVDECKCGPGPHGLPAGASFSSNAGTSASRGLAAASASLRQRRARTPSIGRLAAPTLCLGTGRDESGQVALLVLVAAMACADGDEIRLS